MAIVRTQEAASLTGKSRTTIWRAIKSGRLSAARTESGDFEIEISELERAFGTLAAPAAASSRTVSHDVAMQPNETRSEANILHAELATLRERAASLERENALLREDREDARRERDRLLRIIEEHSAQLRLLTDQRQSPALRWWRRWGRRSRA